MAAVVLGGFVAAVPGAGRAQAATVAAAGRPEAGAAMIGWHEDGDDVDLLRAHEAELGTRFALVRMYQQWQLPNKRVAAMINEGRLVLVSHKPPAGGWAAVASGAEDVMIHKLAETYRAFGREVLFTFHHEPHDDASDVKGGTSGTAADYLAAWRRIRSIFDRVGASHSAGGNVFFAYSATGSWALKAAPGGAPGSGDPLYPGDDLVDVFAHDRYNWASCRNAAWEEFASEWAPLVALAAAHGKPLLAAEFGSPPNGGARNDWFRAAATWLRTDPLARRWMWGFAYFHTLHDTCPWDFLNQPGDGGPGWQDAFRDPYFTGTPFSLASKSSTPVLESAGTAPPSPGVLAPTPTGDPRPAPATPAPPSTSTTRPGVPASPPPAGVAGQPAGSAATGAASNPSPAPTAPSGDTGLAGPAPAAPAPEPGTVELAAAPASPPGAALTGAAPDRPASPPGGTSVLVGLAGVFAAVLLVRRITA